MRPGWAALVLALCTFPAAAQTPVVSCQVGAWNALATPQWCARIHQAARLLQWPPDTDAGLVPCAHVIQGSEGLAWLSRGMQVCSDILNANAEAGLALPVR